jgi:hypothetical protein
VSQNVVFVVICYKTPDSFERFCFVIAEFLGILPGIFLTHYLMTFIGVFV